VAAGEERGRQNLKFKKKKEAEMREAKKTCLLYKRPDGRLTRRVLLFGHMSQKKKGRWGDA
jgi:hypothetical protein